VIVLLSYINMTLCHISNTLSSTQFSHIIHLFHIPTWTLESKVFAGIILLRQQNLLSSTPKHRELLWQQPKLSKNHHFIFLIFTGLINIFLSYALKGYFSSIQSKLFFLSFVMFKLFGPLLLKPTTRLSTKSIMR